MDFPEAIKAPDVKVLESDLVFETPFGSSPPFKLLDLSRQHILTCRMHGWRPGVTRADASRQVFWVFQEAGVERILAEGGVGSMLAQIKPRHLVIPDDYFDFSMRRDVSLTEDYLLIMRRALCPELRQILVEEAAKDAADEQVWSKGTYAVTDGRHFESPAEIDFLKNRGWIVGQSLCPEVYLAREIGACYAGLYLVVNYAEGLGEWQHDELADIFHSEAERVGRIVLATLRRVSLERQCDCRDLRKPTLLKG